MEINLNNVIASISMTLDLSQISSEISVVEDISNVKYHHKKFLYHSKRTTYIALEIAKKLNLNYDIQKSLYISSMLHDIGAVNTMSKSHTSETFIKEHCLVGYSILKSFPHFKDLNHIILYHHENWNGTGPFKAKSEAIPIESQIIRIADLFELLYDDKTPCYKQKSYIIKWISNNSKILFNPKIVENVLNLCEKDIFWFNLQNIYSIDLILDEIIPELNTYIDLKEFENIAYIFSEIIDSSSSFTGRHSRDIGETVYVVSKYIGYDEEKCLKMKIAGLLHDIGKLAIPQSILLKNKALNQEEFSIIKSHVYYTKLILDRIKDIPDISEWASNHHEKLNGKGYPRKLKADELSEESRILCVCDIYQALTEDRPYKKGLSKEKTFSILDNMMKEGFICDKALKYLKEAVYN